LIARTHHLGNELSPSDGPVSLRHLPTPTHTTPEQQAEQVRGTVWTRAQKAGRSTRATPPSERHWLARLYTTTLLGHPISITWYERLQTARCEWYPSFTCDGARIDSVV